ncbi:MAG: chitobiase/beta-hexosaminidase C-terminal domain-containing protein, partial [Edwardsiella sp. (in: enterobacteria)]
LETNVAMPGLIVEYSVDGGKQWQRYDAKAKPSVSGEVQVRTASPDGKRFSRVESVKS